MTTVELQTPLAPQSHQASPEVAEYEIAEYDYTLVAHKRKLYDILSAKATGQVVEFEEIEDASKDLQHSIISEATNIYYGRKAQDDYDLVALGAAGEFIEQECLSLTNAVLDTCEIEAVHKEYTPSPVTEVLENQYKELLALRKSEGFSERDAEILLHDAGINSVYHVRRQINRAVNKSVVTETKLDALQVTPGETTEGAENQPKKSGFLHAARLVVKACRAH